MVAADGEALGVAEAGFEAGAELQAASMKRTTRLIGWKRCNEPMVFRLGRL